MSPRLKLCGIKKSDFDCRFWVQVNRPYGFPIPDISGPAIRVLETCFFIKIAAVSQDGLFPPEVAVIWGNETYAAVQMLRVIPANETINPCLCCCQTWKRLTGITGSILHGSEQRFGIRVVITDLRPAE